MRSRIVTVAILAAGLTACAKPPAVSRPAAYSYHTVPDVIFYDDGGSLELERGLFFVPGNHDDAASALLQLAFYRIAATGRSDTPPLFVLAGGPGSTYFDDLRTERFRDWVDFYREIGDIVILEQRGAGESLPKPVCQSDTGLALDRPLQLDEVRTVLRDKAVDCVETWKSAGLKPTDFNLLQMAGDFDALRQSLGYERFNLKGGSFGSQLGFTIIHEHPERVHRAVLYGIEGLDHTYDLPVHANRQIDKLAGEVANDPQLAALIPDFKALLRRILDGLEAEPALVHLGGATDGQTVAVGASDTWMILWSAALLQGYRDGIEKVPALLLAADSGNFQPLAEAKLKAVESWSSVNVMPYLVDCASGISPARRERLQHTDPSWLLPPDIVDLSLRAVCPALDTVDLGDAFRAERPSDVPVLMITGSLDAFTAPENAEEIIANYHNGHWLHALRGDHSGWNILAEFPALKTEVRAFLAGEPLPADFPTDVEMPRLEFLMPQRPAEN